MNAVKEVGGPSFFALLVIAVSFLPVLTLEAQEGRLFKPLAYTKNFAMVVAAVLAITLDPALRLFFFRKENFRIRPGCIGKVVNGDPGGQDSFGREASDQPHPDAPVRAGGGVEPALEVVGDRGRAGAGGGDGSGLSEAGQRVHAAAGRRRAAVHADHAAGNFGGGGAAADAGAGPDSDAASRKWRACWGSRAARRRPPTRRRFR